MILSPRKLLIIYSIIGLLVLLFFVLLITSFFRQQPQNPPNQALPTPTPVLYTEATYNRTPDGRFRFTPYQKTEIGKTTDADIQQNEQVLSKTVQDSVTIYKVKAVSPLTPDEIRTRNSVVIFEKTKTLLNNKYGPLPALSVYTQEFGQPEATKDNISPYGIGVTAYIYAGKGFTLFANRYTSEVYEIQRYVPMSVEQYKEQYKEFLVSIPIEKLQ